MPSRRARASASRRRSQKETSRRSRLLKRVGLLAAVVVVLALAFTAWQGVRAKDALDAAVIQVRDLRDEIAAGDVDKASATLAELQRSSHTARSSTDGLVWDALAALPVLGRNVEAVQVAARAVDEIAGEALPPVVKVAESINVKVFTPAGGRFDLDAMTKLAPSVTTASKVLSSSKRDIDAIDVDQLLSPLRGPLRTFQEQIDDAESLAGTGATAARLLPTMLGIDGPQRYLLLFQNNAEIRSTGGLPGAFAIVKADHGKLSIERQGSAGDIEKRSRPYIKLTEDEQSIYGYLLGTDFRDTNFTPDFPRTAEIARAMVKQNLDVDVDGVLSIDPVALGYLLNGTGEVKLADGKRLTSQNAVDILLNEVYTTIESPDEQDAYFADAASRIFDSVTDGDGDPRATIDGLAKAAEDKRLMVWSADEKLQAQLQPTRIAGALSAESDVPHVGMYLNDATASKMQYYLDYDTTVASTRCEDDVQTFVATTVITSNAPADASQLPGYITGNGNKAPEGESRMIMRWYAPFGGSVTSLRIDGKPYTITTSKHDGRQVSYIPLQLQPGETFTIEATMTSGEHQTGDGVFTTTLGIKPTPNDVRIPSSC